MDLQKPGPQGPDEADQGAEAGAEEPDDVREGLAVDGHHSAEQQRGAHDAEALAADAQQAQQRLQGARGGREVHGHAEDHGHGVDAAHQEPRKALKRDSKGLLD